MIISQKVYIMKKYMVSLLLLASSLFALGGEEVYTKHCASCHTKDMMMNMDTRMNWRQKMQNSNQEERQAMRQEMMQKMQNKNMKAPSMPMISMRIKHMTDSKDDFVNFVIDYIQNPNQEKGYCMPMAYKRFGVMPAVGKGMSEEERNLVAQWLYDNFKGSWNDSMGGMTCDKKNSNMKSGLGKCGAKQNNNGMKCGSN